MSKQSEWQARQRAEGRCIDCGEPAESKDDGTRFARCPVCLEKQRYRQWLRRRFGEWECPLHRGRAPIASKLRTAEYYCGVRLTDGGRCQVSNTDETDAEAAVRLVTTTATAGELNGEIQGWQCSRHPDAVPRPANTLGHWYCAVRVYGGNAATGYYCGESSATETREQASASRLDAYRSRYGRMPWETENAE